MLRFLLNKNLLAIVLGVLLAGLGLGAGGAWAADTKMPWGHAKIDKPEPPPDPKRKRMGMDRDACAKDCDARIQQMMQGLNSLSPEGLASVMQEMSGCSGPMDTALFQQQIEWQKEFEAAAGKAYQNLSSQGRKWVLDNYKNNVGDKIDSTLIETAVGFRQKFETIGGQDFLSLDPETQQWVMDQAREYADKYKGGLEDHIAAAAHNGVLAGNDNYLRNLTSKGRKEALAYKNQLEKSNLTSTEKFKKFDDYVNKYYLMETQAGETFKGLSAEGKQWAIEQDMLLDSDPSGKYKYRASQKTTNMVAAIRQGMETDASKGWSNYDKLSHEAKIQVYNTYYKLPKEQQTSNNLLYYINHISQAQNKKE